MSTRATTAIRDALYLLKQSAQGAEDPGNPLEVAVTDAMAELEAIERLLESMPEPVIPLRFSPNPPVTFKRTK